MDVFAINMSTDNEGVSSFQKPFGKFISDLIRFFRCHFSRLERLTYLISNYVIFLFTPGTDSVLPFRQSEFRRRCLYITFVCGNQFTICGFLFVFGIVDPFAETFQDGLSFLMVHWDDSCCGDGLHLDFL